MTRTLYRNEEHKDVATTLLVLSLLVLLATGYSVSLTVQTLALGMIQVPTHPLAHSAIAFAVGILGFMFTGTASFRLRHLGPDIRQASRIFDRYAVFAIAALLFASASYATFASTVPHPAS